MDEEIENIVNNLSPEQKLDHDNCIKDGLKDERCPKCNRIFLAQQHFVVCDTKPCPMSNGISFIDMLLGTDEE